MPGLDGYNMGLVQDHQGFRYMSGSDIAVSIYTSVSFGPYSFGNTPIVRATVVNTATITTVSFKVIYSIDPYGVSPMAPSSTVTGTTGDSDWNAASLWTARPAANGFWDWWDNVSHYETTITNVNPIPAGTHILTWNWPNTINLNSSRKISLTIGGAATYAPSDTRPSCDQAPAGTWQIIADPAGAPWNGGSYFLCAPGVSAVSVV